MCQGQDIAYFTMKGDGHDARRCAMMPDPQTEDAGTCCLGYSAASGSRCWWQTYPGEGR